MIENSYIYPFFKNVLTVNHYFENPYFYEEKNVFSNNFNEEEYFVNEVNCMNNINECYSTFTESNLSKFNENYMKKDETMNLSHLVPDKKIYFGLKTKKRPGKGERIFTDKKSYLHTKNKFDNILTKIQVGYVNFLVDFTNIIIEKLGRGDLKFRYIDSSIKKKNKIDFRKKLKEGTIGDILKNDISSKYKKITILNLMSKNIYRPNLRY